MLSVAERIVGSQKPTRQIFDANDRVGISATAGRATELRPISRRGKVRQKRGTESPVNVESLRETDHDHAVVTSQSVRSGENVVSSRDTPARWASALSRRFANGAAESVRDVNSRRFSELELKDIGYPARIEAEKAKPFWRA